MQIGEQRQPHQNLPSIVLRLRPDRRRNRRLKSKRAGEQNSQKCEFVHFRLDLQSRETLICRGGAGGSACQSADLPVNRPPS